MAGSLVAYPSYLYAIRHLPISLVSLYAYINPLIAVALGALLLGEPFSIRIGAAAVLVLAGMWIVGRARGALVFPGVRRRQGLATRAAATATDGRPGSSPRISK